MALELDGNPIATIGPATMTGRSLLLDDNQWADVPKATLGDFGASDFTIMMDYQGTGADASPDESRGALFIRSSQFERPYTGPCVFLHDNGDIVFRTSHDNSMTVAGAIADPTSTASHALRFDKLGIVLRVFVNGVLKGSQRVSSTASVYVTSADLRFGGNHRDPMRQNLKVVLSNIKLLTTVPQVTTFC